MMDELSWDLVARWRQGDQVAASELFRRYAGRLIALTRSRLSDKLASRVDPDDVVQSAYRSFFSNARDGRYDVQTGLDLWALLVTITLHKVQDQIDRLSTQKRAIDREQTFGSEDSLHSLQAHVLAGEPSPVEAVALTDEVERVMRGLEPVQRRMLELRLQGYNVAEIASETQRSECTVRRFMKWIRQEMQQSGLGPSTRG